MYKYNTSLIVLCFDTDSLNGEQVYKVMNQFLYRPCVIVLCADTEFLFGEQNLKMENQYTCCTSAILCVGL